jgi:hypothetical protein
VLSGWGSVGDDVVVLGSYSIEEHPQLTEDGVDTNLGIRFMGPEVSVRVLVTPEQAFRLAAELAERAARLLPEDTRL